MRKSSLPNFAQKLGSIAILLSAQFAFSQILGNKGGGAGSECKDRFDRSMESVINDLEDNKTRLQEKGLWPKGLSISGLNETRQSVRLVGVASRKECRESQVWTACSSIDESKIYVYCGLDEKMQTPTKAADIAPQSFLSLSQREQDQKALHEMFYWQLGDADHNESLSRSIVEEIYAEKSYEKKYASAFSPDAYYVDLPPSRHFPSGDLYLEFREVLNISARGEERWRKVDKILDYYKEKSEENTVTACLFERRVPRAIQLQLQIVRYEDGTLVPVSQKLLEDIDLVSRTWGKERAKIKSDIDKNPSFFCPNEFGTVGFFPVKPGAEPIVPDPRNEYLYPEMKLVFELKIPRDIHSSSDGLTAQSILVDVSNNEIHSALDSDYDEFNKLRSFIPRVPKFHRDIVMGSPVYFGTPYRERLINRVTLPQTRPSQFELYSFSRDRN